MEFTVRQSVGDDATPQVTDLCRHMALRLGDIGFPATVVRVELLEDGGEALVTYVTPDSEIILVEYDRDRGGNYELNGYRAGLPQPVSTWCSAMRAAPYAQATRPTFAAGHPGHHVCPCRGVNATTVPFAAGAVRYSRGSPAIWA